jgi:hypothetical protein
MRSSARITPTRCCSLKNAKCSLYETKCSLLLKHVLPDTKRFQKYLSGRAQQPIEILIDGRWARALKRERLQQRVFVQASRYAQVGDARWLFGTARRRVARKQPREVRLHLCVSCYFSVIQKNRTK